MPHGAVTGEYVGGARRRTRIVENVASGAADQVIMC